MSRMMLFRQEAATSSQKILKKWQHPIIHWIFLRLPSTKVFSISDDLDF
jgi:hypothetical protein